MTANAQWTTIDLLQTYKASVGASAVGATVMRTHLWVLPHGIAAFDRWWIGLSVGDLNDIQAGVPTNNALVPNPKDDPYIDWMFVRQNLNDNTLNSGAPGQSTWQGINVDLKSKRRMHQVQMAYTLTIYQDNVTTVAKNYDWFARTLIALP